MSELRGYIDEEHWASEIRRKSVFNANMIGLSPDLCPKCQHEKKRHDSETGCMIDLKHTNSGRTHHGSFGIYCSCLWGYDHNLK